MKGRGNHSVLTTSKMAEGWLFNWHYLVLLFVVTTKFFPGSRGDSGEVLSSTSVVIIGTDGST